MQTKDLSIQTQAIIATLQAIPEIWDQINMVIHQDDKTGAEHIVLWHKP